ncbi:hypothetical protein Vadar_000396 [Vaccinium darrowii]|uniref:Uncharacterized protein n=1 Tax=Vaccinium darrowii TaxID=229202 RepID=A0ACB7XVM9_9ERIC|nr:hypothetical protein Vadar_000396 [Vaccinium darrowii]
MAFEPVVFQQDHFGYTTTDVYNMLGGNWSCDQLVLPAQEQEEYESFGFLENQTEPTNHSNWECPVPSPLMGQYLEQWGPNPNSSLDPDINTVYPHEEFQHLEAIPNRPTRRRSKSKKNHEEMENQRMTHIAVERNRRKQMNEYLSVLRGLMPDSYVQRGDQASIVGGAINYVKELEQNLHFLGGKTQVNKNFEAGSSSMPFDDFFSFPQYSTNSSSSANSVDRSTCDENSLSAMADIEVTMVESHANLKIRCRKRPKQLMKLVSGLQSLRLSILHLNVSTVDQIVLYSLSVKVEEDCMLTSVDEIAAGVNQLLGRIQQEAA